MHADRTALKRACSRVTHAATFDGLQSDVASPAVDAAPCSADDNVVSEVCEASFRSSDDALCAWCNRSCASELASDTTITPMAFVQIAAFAGSDAAEHPASNNTATTTDRRTPMYPHYPTGDRRTRMALCTNASHNASQLASTMFPCTPTVVHSRSPSVDSTSTRVTASVPCELVNMRTL